MQSSAISPDDFEQREPGLPIRPLKPRLVRGCSGTMGARLRSRTRSTRRRRERQESRTEISACDEN